MRTKTEFFVRTLTCSMCLLICCSLFGDETQSVQGITVLNEVPLDVSTSRLEVSDDSFRLSIASDGELDFVEKATDSTIEDLYNFAQTTCYNAKLHSKLATGEPLARDEVRLLEFVLEVEAAMVGALTQSIFVDMMNVTESSKDYPQVILDEKSSDECSKPEQKKFRQLVINYLKSEDTLRKKTGAYCGFYSGMSSEIKKTELGKIVANVWADERRDKIENINRRDLLLLFSSPGRLVEIYSMNMFERDHVVRDLSQVEKDAMNIKLDGEFNIVLDADNRCMI